jgi:hypothetical protein
MAEALQADPAELLAGSPSAPSKLPKGRFITNHSEPDADVIPVYSFEDVEGAKTINKRVAGYTPRPPALRGVRDGYAIYAPDDSMEPRYCAGWLLYVNPVKPARPGRDVVVWRRRGTPLLRQLDRTTKDGLVARPLGKGDAVAEEDIVRTHLIVGCSHEG